MHKLSTKVPGIDNAVLCSHFDKKFMSMGLKGYVKIFDKDKDALASLVEDL